MSKGYGTMILLLQLLPIVGAVVFIGLMAADLVLLVVKDTEISDALGTIAVTGWAISALGVGTGSMGVMKTIGNNGKGLSKGLIFPITILSWISLIIGVLAIGLFIVVICNIHV